MRVPHKAACATVLNGLSAIAPQVISLLSLGSADFGRFSAAYLGFALATSMVLSLLCDAWVVLERQKPAGDAKDYTRILTTLCLVFGFFSGLITWLLVDPLLGAMTAISVIVATYRLGQRYFLVHSRQWGRVIGSDALVVLITASVYFVGLFSLGSSLELVMLAWISGTFAGSIICGIPAFGLRFTYGWLRRHKRVIIPLTVDAGVMDIASIGTPYILLPQLGIGGFGLYRAISNLSAPLRLLIAPVRPVIIGAPHRGLTVRVSVLIMTVAVLSGCVVGSGLFFVGIHDIELGVLSELRDFWLPAGIYVFATLLLVFYSLVCRALNHPRRLFVGRSAQTVLGFAGPIAGFLFWGLAGAIYAFASVTLLSALVWMLVAFAGRRKLS